jgi:hypothetical protein
MKYIVTAVSVFPKYPNTFSGAREEKIDTETDDLFAHCRGPWEVEDAYADFWNRLNHSDEYNWPEHKEKVLVISVVPA